MTTFRVKPHDLEPLYREVEAAERKVAEMRGAVDEELSRIDRRDLKPEAVRRQEREIRAKAAMALEPVRRQLAEAREALERQVAHYTPDRIRSRARFDPKDELKNAQIGSFELARVALVPDLELVAEAEDAAADGRLALAVAISREARRRNLPAEVRSAILAATHAAPLPEHEAAAAERVAESIRRVDLAEVRMTEITTGVSNPTGRLGAALGGPAAESLDEPATEPGASPAQRLAVAFAGTN